MKSNTLSWGAQVLVAVILGQTLFFKFTDHPETVALFSTLGLGAVAYKSIGVLELLACLFILMPRTIIYGAILSLGLMTGAIMAHLTKIGFSGAYGQLGAMAIVAALLSVGVIWVHRVEIPFIGRSFKGGSFE